MLIIDIIDSSHIRPVVDWFGDIYSTCAMGLGKFSIHNNIYSWIFLPAIRIMREIQYYLEFKKYEIQENEKFYRFI